MNTFKQKTSMTKLNIKIVIISILDNFKKESLLISILKTKVLILNTKKLNIAIININTYWIAYKLKSV